MYHGQPTVTRQSLAGFLACASVALRPDVAATGAGAVVADPKPMQAWADDRHAATGITPWPLGLQGGSTG